MLNRLLFISGLLCLLIAQGLQAQQLKVVAETSTFTDYEFINNELLVLSPYGMLIPVNGNTPRFEILEQRVESIERTISEDKALVMALSDASTPLIETSLPGTYRGKKVSSSTIHFARTAADQILVLSKLKLRIYKDGDEVLPNSTIRNSASSFTDFSEGEWFKIPIRENSIHQLNFEYLEELGLNLSNIDPRNIQLWRTNGYQLPEANSASRPQLSQIPILVQGAQDGVFNSPDRILFYGNDPHQVIRNNGTFSHQLHSYSDINYVFLTVGNEPGIRISQANDNLVASRTITSFPDFIWKDDELYKAEEQIKSGREWLGQRFETSSNGSQVNIFSDTLAGYIPGTPINISGQFVNRSTSNAFFEIVANGTQIRTLSIPRSGSYTSSEGQAGVSRNFTLSTNLAITDGILNLAASYNHNASGSVGYVDWLEITAERELLAEEGRLFFYSPNDGNSTEIGNFELKGFETEPKVFDVTNVINPIEVPVEGSAGNYRIKYITGDDLRFTAQTSFTIPDMGQKIDTQNLKGITEYPDYIIVTSESLLDQANELASYRLNKDGLNSVVVTQQQIMNEFSSGALDPTAIRDYVKFLYDRALSDGQEPPLYLLLFGDTTFDFKGIIPDSFTNHVLTYQSKESLHRVNSYPTDDYFGFLDDSEGDLGNGQTGITELLDIGLGRISAQNTTEANIAVQKIKSYESAANTGSWQNLFTFAADDDFPDVERNRDLHVLNANESAQRMNIAEPGIRIKKIYEFAYPEEITGAGRKVPGATEAFIQSINNGTLVLNYSGHGNEQTLSDEELFLSEYIPRLSNEDRLAVLVTATCQFGRYDDIDSQSGAEKMFFAPNGGIIAAFTTTRVVYTGSSITSNNNFGLNVVLSQRMIEKNADGSPLRMGQIYTRTKNSSINGSPVISSRNSKKFILIGDPATRFRLPEQKTKLTSLNDYIENEQDTVLTIKALDQVNLSGEIRDLNDNVLSSYSGEAFVTVLDAKRTVNLPTDRDWVQEDRCNLNDCNYTVENDVLFRGKAAVQNGIFSSTFIIPKDISFSDSTGRILFYANNNGLTAGGSFTKVRFNGVNENAVNDGKGPTMDVYLNDERFVNGNLVNSSPKLIIELEDQSGINTTGTGVGHEIIATIDTKPQQSFVLNDFYEGSLNDFTRGRIEYPLDQLPEGNYSLQVRAWDVHNNPSEKDIFFEVASSEELSVQRVYNYPNPMNDATRFTFEHNQPGNLLDVSVRIYTLSGKPVQQIEQSLITTSSYGSISWNGRDRDNDRLGNGTYIYVLRVAADTPKGRQKTEQIEKLVIIR